MNTKDLNSFQDTQPQSVEQALFYTSKWYVFDNFSSFAIMWRGIMWMTVEHAYQAAKFSDQSIVAAIISAPSAHVAKKIGNLPENQSKKWPDWDQNKVGVMRELLRAKTEQHEYVRKKLIQSGDMELVEDSPTDSFWGRGPNWSGKNWLGILWMELREELRTQVPNV